MDRGTTERGHILTYFVIEMFCNFDETAMYELTGWSCKLLYIQHFHIVKPSFLLVLTVYVTPAPQDTTSLETHEAPPHPPRRGSLLLSIVVTLAVAVFCVVVLLLVLGLLQRQKHRGTEKILTTILKLSNKMSTLNNTHKKSFCFSLKPWFLYLLYSCSHFVWGTNNRIRRR